MGEFQATLGSMRSCLKTKREWETRTKLGGGTLHLLRQEVKASLGYLVLGQLSYTMRPSL